jgi:transposase-like protein
MAQDTGTNGTATKKRVRGRWSAEQRQLIVKASLVEGVSINEVAEQHGIRANLLTAWRRRHAAATRSARRPLRSLPRYASPRWLPKARSRLTCRTTSCGYVGSSMLGCCARCWRLRDDRIAEWSARMAGLWFYGPAQRIRRPRGSRADSTFRGRVLGSAVCFSRPPR